MQRSEKEEVEREGGDSVRRAKQVRAGWDSEQIEKGGKSQEGRQIKGVGGVTCALSCTLASAGTAGVSWRAARLVTEVDWTSTFVLSRGGETLLSDTVTPCPTKAYDELSGHPV